jgi:hypothetical protein
MRADGALLSCARPSTQTNHQIHPNPHTPPQTPTPQLGYGKPEALDPGTSGAWNLRQVGGLRE